MFIIEVLVFEAIFISDVAPKIAKETFKWHRNSKKVPKFNLTTHRNVDKLTSGVSFTNILCTAFSYGGVFKLFFTYSLAGYFFRKRILAQKLLIKCWWNWQLAWFLCILLSQIAIPIWLKSNELFKTLSTKN